MRRAILLAAVLLVGCGEKGAPPEAALRAVSLAEAPAPEAAASDIAAPQIAYRYTRRYRTPTGGLAALQARHVALCDRAGRSACHIVSQRLADDGAGSELVLSVAAPQARTLLAALDSAATGTGSAVAASTTEAEDLSRQIVDGEARLKAKQALADRLLAIIRTRAGSIKDAVAAEQAFAQAQADLESARAELALMRTQVARSTLTLSYDTPAGVQSSFSDMLRPAFDDAGAMLGGSIAALVRLVILTLPWLLLLGLPLAWLWRRRRR